MNLARDIATYAWRKDGKYYLLWGIILYLIADIAMVAPFFGAVACLLILGFGVAMGFEIIRTSAAGRDDAPDFPEISNVWDDVALPLVQMAGAMLVSFSPLLIAHYYFDGETPSWLVLGLWFVCEAYLGMAVLAVVIMSTLSSINPVFVIPSLFRAGWLFWSAVLAFVSLNGLLGFLEEYIDNPWLTWPSKAFLTLYVLMTYGRVLGLVFRHRAAKLRW